MGRETEYASVEGSQWQIVAAERLPTRGRRGFKCSIVSRTGTRLGALQFTGPLTSTRKLEIG
jgi:hypothetical protein